MRSIASRFVVLSILAAGIALAAAPGAAQATFKGLWLSTPYPAESLATNQPISLNIEVHNAGLPPEQVALSVSDAPKGWSSEFIGDGKPVGAVFVDPDSSKSVTVKLVPPDGGIAPGTYRFALTGAGADGTSTLPVSLSFGRSVLPARLTMSPELPDLHGTPTSKFEYDVKLANESGSDATARLEAQAPVGFEVTFKEKYGSQELTSVPVKAGETKDLKVTVKPPTRTKAGVYKVAVRADTGKSNADANLTLDVSGRPELTLTGPGDRLSTDASAGEDTPLILTVANTGSAPAKNIKLTASPPSGWKVAFAPQAIDMLDAGQQREIAATITPSSKAITGDYMVNVRANGDTASKAEAFRISVETSTMWGIVGVLVIAAALAVLSLAVIRFGRR